MSERGVRPTLDRVSSTLSQVAAAFRPSVLVREEGRVESVSDCVLGIVGLSDAALEELLEIDGRVRAVVLGLQRGEIEAVALEEHASVAGGASVRALGRVATVGVGEALLGRVVDPLGNALDGAELRGALRAMPLERRAPAIHERAEVHSPLYTGVLAVDAMFPIGRGQRELIVGEDGSGKTSLALDAMLRQRGTDVVAVYVAIGRRRADTWQVVDALRKGGGRWVVVSAPDDASPGMRYLAPFAGTTVAEHFADRGEHALVVYDDLTAHAVAWRELSLLLKRPPGREAYPGDIFYLHARLLERAAQLSAEKGGGSVTALPIVVLEGGRLSAYIPTNLISITDGQIVLSHALFAAGQKPAVNAGLSVSRIGSKAQAQALRELAGRLRLDYAAFLELEVFARLGTRLEESTRRRIEIGRRVRALLRARRLAPLGVFEEVVRLCLAEEHDILLQIPEDDVEATAAWLVGTLRREMPGREAAMERDAVLSEVDRRVMVDVMARAVAGRRGSWDEPEVIVVAEVDLPVDLDDEPPEVDLVPVDLDDELPEVDRVPVELGDVAVEREELPRAG